MTPRKSLKRFVSNLRTDNFMKMKLIACFMLVTFVQYCSGQTDTSVLAVGDWSAPVTDGVWPLRGRLLVYDAVADKGNDVMWPEARVYLELQHVADVPMAMKLSIGVFTDDSTKLHFEMRDGHDKLIKTETILYNVVQPDPFLATLPPDSTLRVRIDRGVRSQTPDGLMVCVPGGAWTIWPGATDDYYLSATFSHPTNNLSDLNYHVWQGTLQLPKVKIPTDKIRKR
jgi:hypothetical protein